MTGSMLISGRRTGQCRLDIKGDAKLGLAFIATGTATNPNATEADIEFDAQQKLDEIKANPSPVESEIQFIEEWFRVRALVAQEVSAAPIKTPELPDNITPIDSKPVVN